MTVDQVLAKLKSLGNEKVRQHNTKNGAGENQFGVKLGDIRTIAKGIKTNNSIAKQLWKTSNVDAQLLAILITDVKTLPAAELEEMVRTVTIPQVADWLNSYIVKEHADKEQLRVKWMQSPDKWLSRSGWSLTSGRVAREPKGIDIAALLGRLEKQMPVAAPEVQWTMNTTLAYIGINFPEHRKRALTIGEKLGIYRDYPVPKGCTSPFAPIWINEMVSRQVKA